MGREPKQRRLTGFPKIRPNTLGRIWQQRPQEGQEPDSWALDEQSQQMPQMQMREPPQQAGWGQLPRLPKWPPLPEEDPLAPGRLSDERDRTLDDMQPTDEHEALPWNRRDTDWADGVGRPAPAGALWRQFQLMPRRLKIGVAAGAGVVLLCAAICALTLGSTLGPLLGTAGNGTPNTHSGAPLPGLGQISPTASTTATGTATAVATPGQTAPLTIAFTCASGAIGGSGQVCITTRPNASVNLTVRYCDGSYASGKGFHGAAHADGNGSYTWRWDVRTSCAGTTTATVTAKSSGQTITQSTTFTISR